VIELFNSKTRFLKRSVGSFTFDVFNAAILIILAILTLYPFLRVLAVSLSSPFALTGYPLTIIPRNFSLASYVTIFHNPSVTTGFKNSIWITLVGTFFDTFLTVMLAYPLSKKRLPHRTFFTMFFVATMFFNAGMIPTFLNIKDLGLINTYGALLFPRMINTFNMLICRNFFMSISPEIEESASVDGANDISILFKLIIPISKPIIITLILWYGVARWNSYFDCLLYVSDSKKYLLSVVLRDIITKGSNERVSADRTSAFNFELVRTSVIIVSTIPILLVYPFLQKYFVKGIMIGSLKG
jgi:putative aldouronate transport system permease protein